MRNCWILSVKGIFILLKNIEWERVESYWVIFGGMVYGRIRLKMFVVE